MTMQTILLRRLAEETEGLREAETCAAEQRGKIELLQQLADEIAEEKAAETTTAVFTEEIIAGALAPQGFSRERVEIALEVYEELLRRVSPEPLRPFKVHPGDNTVLEWMHRHGGGIQGLRKWAIEQSGFFQSVLIMITPERRDLLVWDYEVIPAIIDRCDFRLEWPTVPTTDELHAMIDVMTANQMAEITKRAGGAANG